MATYQDTLHRVAADEVPFRVAGRRGIAVGRLMLALKASLTLGALVLVGRFVDTRVLFAHLQTIPGTVLLAALALLAAQIGLVAIRWRTIVAALLGVTGTLPGLSRFTGINFAAVLLGQLLPSVAGDGLRVILARDAGLPLRTAVESTLLDRVVALLMLLVLALPAVTFSPLFGLAGIRMPALAVLAAGLATSVAAIASAGPLSRVPWRLVALGGDVLFHLRGLLADRSRGGAVFGLSAVVHGSSVLVFTLLARGQGLPLGFADACAVVPMVLLIQMVPVAIGGWGLREGLVVTLFGLRGIGPEDALLLSVSFGALQIVAALPGIAVLVRSTWASRRRPALA